MALSQKGQLTAKPADKQQQPQKKPPAGSSLAPFLNSTNLAPNYAIKIMHSQMAQTSGSLQVDYKLLSSGHAIYLSHCLCAADDFSLLRRLTGDLEKNNVASMIQWSRHLKHENPSFSPTFQEIVDRMAAHFDVDVYASRLNFYPDNTSWKPFHHDSHAYAGPGKKEDFTMGASFGATRELVFMHPKSGGQQFSFPQKNGDVFAFDSVVNQRFMHGVPRATASSAAPAPRFSIIAWGRRRSLTAKNAGKDDIGKRSPYEEDLLSDKELAKSNLDESADKKEQAMSMEAVREAVEKFIEAQPSQPVAPASKPAAPKVSRIQQGGAATRGKAPAGRGGGWGAMKKAAESKPAAAAVQNGSSEGDSDEE